MARPREFEEAAVLDAATDCFWRNGYEATSVRDLAAQMGITGTSLYNAFGDKRSLFRRALERYVERSMRARIARLESTLSPKDAVRAFVTEIVERSLDDPARRGCLLVNSALEIAPHDPRLGAEIADRLHEIESFFRRAVTAAQADGTVPRDRSPRDLARLLLGVILGIRVLARTNPSRALLEGVARPALDLLDRPPHSKKGAKR
jgi:TetR/AcrR family transcriptional regulator, transcriptional repressor for nem operon